MPSSSFTLDLRCASLVREGDMSHSNPRLPQFLHDKFAKCKVIANIQLIIRGLTENSVVAICGPSCSGKSSLAAYLSQHESCDTLSMDAFFKPIPDIPEHLTGIPAFDSIDAIDIDLLLKSITPIKSGQSVHVPVYHYSRTTVGRDQSVQELFKARKVTLLDGTLSSHPRLQY